MKRSLLILCILLMVCPLAHAGPTITGGGKSTVVADTSPQLGGDLDLNGYNIDFPTTANISDCLDEDDMASDSATKLSTQQAIKAFHESGVLDALGLDLLTAEPASPVAGKIYYADISEWNPAGALGAVDYFAGYTGSAWIALWNKNFEFLFSSIEVPTMLASELNDTSDPHLLTVAELKNTIITNSESGGADEWDFPARTEGWNFIFVKEADQNIALDPNGSENWWFRTGTSAYTQNGAGTSIDNTTAGKSTISIFSTESGVYCTGDANWEQGS